VAFRIVWYEGWPYPVTGHPRRADEESSHWYVQTRDGVWHPVMNREPRTSLTDVWGALEGKVHDWLAANVVGQADLPPTLAVEVTLHPPARGSGRLRSVLAGIVNTERGQCYVELATVSRLPKPRVTDVIKHARNRRPAVFSVNFRTTNHPLGVHLQFEAADFLEAVVQQYLRRRPDELPIAQPASWGRR
jgi:hypothetical protein